MTVLESNPEILQVDPVAKTAEIIDFPLNKELVFGRYNDHDVYALGKTAMSGKNWLGLIRLGGFHLILSDVQKISGYFTDAIERQLAIANSIYAINPGFTSTLEEDVAETRQIMSSGYLLSKEPVVDYVWLGCMDTAGCRLVIHPDRENEHVDQLIREHTLSVAKSILAVY